jgi:sensor histidine kinase YesM
MKKKQHLIIVLILSLFVGILIFLYVNFSITGLAPNLTGNSVLFQFSILTSLILGLSFYYSSQKLNKILLWDKRFFTRISAGMMINMIIALILTMLMFLIYLAIFIRPQDYLNYFTRYQDPLIKTLILLFVFTLTVTILEFLFYSYKQYEKVQIESIKLTREQLEQQYTLLKNQLSPHFLFNSLNTISSLIYRDVRIAEKFIREFAKTYQYILSTHSKNLVSLHEELEFVRAFGYILQIRFENALKIEYKIPDDKFNTKIPPLSLQLLAENAVKHNIITEENPLIIEIFIENENYIVVRNNFIGKPYYLKINQKLYKKPVERSYKIGLENIKKRYSYFTNDKVHIMKDDFFTVKLPIILK